MKIFKTFIDKFLWCPVKRQSREINVCAHALVGGVLGLVVSSAAFALPQGGVVKDGSLGSGGIAYGNRTTIDQKGAGGTQNVTIRWDSFDTAPGEHVHFKQRANQAAINRIRGNANGIGGNTIFNGGLTGAGTIILINQNGFLFGPGSQIRVGSFMATTTGKGIPGDLGKFSSWVNKHKKADHHAEIINQGSITITKDGGFGLLVAPYVRNDGTIKNKNGVNDVTIGLGSIGVKNKTKKDGKQGVTNTGKLRARSGYVAMVNTIFNASVNIGGILDADQFGSNGKGGTILVASKGDINLQGAKFSARGGRDVEVRLDAKDDILSNDEVTTFKLRADGVHTKRVKANLDMEADGVIDIRTDASVVANGSDAEAEFDVEGKRGVAITTGDETILVKATAVGTKASRGNAYADADLDIDSQGNVEVNGHVVVKAKANARGWGSAGAYADVEIGHEWMADKVAINGDIDVTARANNNSYRRSRAEAVATSSIVADGKDGEITYVGDLNINAKSRGGNSRSMAGGILRSSGDIDYNGDLNINAKSRGRNSMSLAGGLLLSSGDIVYNGNSNGSANAKSRGRSSDAIAAAGLAMLAGFNMGGSGGQGWIRPATLTMNGDVLVEANAKAEGPGSGARALGLGILAAGGDVNINTDPVIVNSIAKSKGKKSFSASLAGLITVAGLDSIEAGFTGGEFVPYDLSIVGDLEANSIAKASKDRREIALAANLLLASGDITIRGADPLASANDALAQGRSTMFEVCGDGNIGCLSGPGFDFDLLLATLFPGEPGNGYAQLVIEAGGAIDIQPKPDVATAVPGSPNEVFSLRQHARPSGKTGSQPLSFADNGDMLAATGFGVTLPPPIKVADVKSIDVEAAILAGADPGALLPPTAAGGEATSINEEDTMTASAAPDFCDRLVSGACYESE
jgi:filamentous hemagglutinin family protein